MNSSIGILIAILLGLTAGNKILSHPSQPLFSMLNLGMSYPQKTQTRIWTISVIYKHLLLGLPLPYIKREINTLEELADFFQDHAVFAHKKGDLNTFIAIYNSVSSNFDELLNMISQILDKRSLSCLSKACLLCALAEVSYIKACEPGIVIGTYGKLLHIYGEDSAVLSKFFRATN